MTDMTNRSIEPMDIYEDEYQAWLSDRQAEFNVERTPVSYSSGAWMTATGNDVYEGTFREFLRDCCDEFPDYGSWYEEGRVMAEEAFIERTRERGL